MDPRPRGKLSISALPSPGAVRPSKLPRRWHRAAAAVPVFLFFAALLYYLLLRPAFPASAASLWGGTRRREPSEVWGLLHLVTQGADSPSAVASGGEKDVRYLGHTVRPESPVPLHVYAGGERVDWDKAVKEIEERSPVVVFSKTYCPYSRRAKTLLESYDLYPPPKIVEVDLREDAPLIKALLVRLTGRGTVPNVLLHGRSIGGSDDLQALHLEGRLRGMFEDGGVEVRGDVGS